MCSFRKHYISFTPKQKNLFLPFLKTSGDVYTSNKQRYYHLRALKTLLLGFHFFLTDSLQFQNFSDIFCERIKIKAECIILAVQSRTTSKGIHEFCACWLLSLQTPARTVRIKLTWLPVVISLFLSALELQKFIFSISRSDKLF